VRSGAIHGAHIGEFSSAGNVSERIGAVRVNGW
jgi:hypothetical protein